jgi:hypothetical protein
MMTAPCLTPSPFEKVKVKNRSQERVIVISQCNVFHLTCQKAMPGPHGIGMIMLVIPFHSCPSQRTPNHEKSIQAPLLFGGGGERALGRHLSRGGVLGGAVQVVLAFATDIAHVGRL